MRRVVVTGLGAITPLGVGVRRTWTKLLAGDSGIVSLTSLQPADRWKELTSTVAGIVPEGDDEGKWSASQWLSSSEQRRMSRFTQYAVAAGDMALKDAGLESMGAQVKESTGVCLGSGIGNLEEMYETSLAHKEGVCETLLDKRNLLTWQTGIQESLAIIRPQDPHQHGCRTYRYEVRVRGTQPCSHNGLHDRRPLHW